jgi:hypothetical protein
VQADNSTKYNLPERRNPGSSPGDNQQNIISTLTPPSTSGNFSTIIAAAPPLNITSTLGMDAILSAFGPILSKLGAAPASAPSPARTSPTFRHRRMLKSTESGRLRLLWVLPSYHHVLLCHLCTAHMCGSQILVADMPLFLQPYVFKVLLFHADYCYSHVACSCAAVPTTYL